MGSVSLVQLFIPSFLPLWILFVITNRALADIYPRSLPRSDPLTIPIQALSRRSPANTSTFGGGITHVAFASDRQTYYALINVAGIMNFRVALDTASSDLWLISSNCTISQCRQTARYPLPYASSTFGTVNSNTTAFSARYADGTYASGFVAKETIAVSNFTLANHAFGLVSDTNTSLPDHISGILGLGFPRLSSIATSVPTSRPFFTRLAQEGLLEYPLFGFSLTRNDTGTLSLGAIDASVVKNASDIAWSRVAQFPPFGAENNVSSYLNWAVQLNGFAVNTTQFTPIPTQSLLKTKPVSLALIDIGAAGIYGPYQDVSNLFGAIDGARLVDASIGQWAVPCDSNSFISFTFGTRKFILQPTDYLIGPAAGNPNLCLSWPRAVPPNNDGIDWQFGSAFLRTVYTVFNYGINGKEPPYIGFYALPTNGTETPTAISSFFSSYSATVSTTLPNFVLPTPTFTTPPYVFNTSVPATIGGIVTSDLANSTYSAIFAQRTSFNASAIPTISPPQSVVTVIITDPAGDTSTVVSTYTMAAVTLGLPGFSAGTCLHVSFTLVVIPSVVIWTLLS